MPFDYKRAYPEYYLPPKTPQILEIPPMNFLAVRGSGNPNEEGGDYRESIGLVYAVAYTLRMSARAGHGIEGFFNYVVPPLEGLWRQQGNTAIDLAHKESFQWISMIRLPEFVTERELEWAVREASQRKKRYFSKVQWFSYSEGLCVQCLHVGPYDAEPATIAAMEAYALLQGCALDLSGIRQHHEIYLSDARRCKAENLKTVIRLPIRQPPKCAN
ncbi:MAG TPA: GyrI-like domain-containing protein [Candidatus Pullichristensenella excrementigallinarum]|uniref:GyrI-like domain-containing protein n=1 Tax=Candidatus Pullichristensenella excrementigallinarum TaxID=2840907 RepID=A0A9D1LA35_9FIRM|nr:GyrI-like domain-containing protein [Candidatus Pullichristensenella excrementigallinarum]